MDAGAYRIADEPSHVVDGDGTPLSGHYEVEFVTDGGERITRYLTDKGRAALLRRMDGGQRVFSAEEVRDFTTEPDLDELVARTKREAGEGS
jgi:hypothetical protein